MTTPDPNATLDHIDAAIAAHVAEKQADARDRERVWAALRVDDCF